MVFPAPTAVMSLGAVSATAPLRSSLVRLSGLKLISLPGMAIPVGSPISVVLESLLRLHLIEKGDFVVVSEEKADTIIAVGISLISHEDFRKIKKGKAVRVINHLKDEIWTFRL